MVKPSHRPAAARPAKPPPVTDRLSGVLPVLAMVSGLSAIRAAELVGNNRRHAARIAVSVIESCPPSSAAPPDIQDSSCVLVQRASARSLATSLVSAGTMVGTGVGFRAAPASPRLTQRRTIVGA